MSSPRKTNSGSSPRDRSAAPPKKVAPRLTTQLLARRLRRLEDALERDRPAALPSPDRWTYRLIIFFLGSVLLTATVATMTLELRRTDTDTPLLLWVVTVGAIIALAAMGIVHALGGRDWTRQPGTSAGVPPADRPSESARDTNPAA